MHFESDLAKSIFESKYLLEGETTADESDERLVREFAKNFPEMEEQAREYFDKMWYVPAGGVRRASGNLSKKVSHINCTTLKPVEDNLESIFDSLYRWAKYAAYGEGEGIDISNLRPRGAKVHNSSRSSTGAVSFMQLFDSILKVISQQGRRGASLISIKDSHPDLEEFIAIKDKPESDKSRIDTANISIQASDAFMQAVKDDATWVLSFENEYENVEKEVSAKALFTKVCEMAWKRGDPGLQFIDKARRESNSDQFGFNIVSTNACCLTGNTLVTTKSGVIPIKNLEGKEVEIFDGENWVSNNNFKSYGEDEIYRVTLNNGAYFDVTQNHRFYLTDGRVIQTHQLSSGDFLESNPDLVVKGGIKTTGAYLKGFMLGDGTVDSFSSLRPLLYLYSPKYMCKTKLEESLQEVDKEEVLKTNINTEIGWTSSPSNLNRVTMKGLTARGRDELYKWGSIYKKSLPLEVYNWEDENKYDFIAGLLDSDGSALDSPKGFGYQLSSIHKEFLVDVLRLLSTINIYGKISQTKVGEYKDKRGKNYFCQSIWRLTIPQKYAIDLSRKVKFQRLTSFSSRSISSFRGFKYNKVVSIEKLNRREEVYCTTVPTTSKFFVNSGIITGNSEQYLDPDNSCNLGHINLAKFNEYGWEGFQKLVRFGVYFGVSVILNELAENRSPTPEQRKKLKEMPRVGLGLTGLADYFIDNEIVYGSEESVAQVSKIFKTLASVAYKTNGEIGKKLGSFPSYNKDTMKQSAYIQRLLEHDLITDEDLEYQYCIALVSIAPVGTGALVTNGGGSGIEPIFSKYMVRRERATTNDWKEWFVFNPAVERYLKKYGYEVTKENADALINPWWATSYSVNSLDKLNLVAEAQKWIDSSISVTFNLPEDATVEDVKNIYMTAWEKGLKGVTVYREGSLAGVLITEKNYNKQKQEAKKIHDDSYVKRPECLHCDIHETTYKGEKYVTLVGMLDGKPYEVFVTPNDGSMGVEKHKTGKIVKKSSGHYDLVVENGITKTMINNIGKTFDSMYGTLSRMVSMSMRHNVPLQFIVDQLNKDSNIVGFEKTLSRVLKKYIKDATMSRKKCPDCGGGLMFIDGCLTCSSCGWSKCD